MKQKGSHAGLRQLLRPYGGRLTVLSLCTLLLAVIQVAMALLMQQVIDAAVAGDPRVWTWAALLIADLVAQVLLHGLHSWLTGSTVDRFAAGLRGKILKCAAYSRDSRLQEFHSGALVSRGMEDVHTVCDGTVNAFPQLVGQLTRLLAAFAALALLYPAVAGILLAAGACVAGGICLARPALKRRQRAVRVAEETVMSAMQEDMAQLELLQSLQAQEQSLSRFEKLLQKSLKTKAARRVFTVGAAGTINTASMAGTGILLIWGATQVATGALSYGALTAMLQLMGQFKTPVLGLSGLWTRLSAVEVAAERLELLTREPELPEALLPVDAEAVVFENVTFAYPGEQQPVVEGLSMTLPLKGWSALGGISGRGKSTLFKLILGLYTPQTGAVSLLTPEGKVPCTEAVRGLFAYVPQDYALFSGTIRENLLLVAPEATEDQCCKALTAAAAEFVFDLTEGLDTHVGENNTGLSKGQLQRIAVARALLMERRVLLLDECTSALDGETEKKLLENLYARQPNALLVTHRPEALEILPKVERIQM